MTMKLARPTRKSPGATPLQAAQKAVLHYILQGMAKRGDIALTSEKYSAFAAYGLSSDTVDALLNILCAEGTITFHPTENHVTIRIPHLA